MTKLNPAIPPRALAWMAFWFVALVGSAWCAAAIYGGGALILIWIAAGAAYNFGDVSSRWQVPDEDDQQQRLD